MTTWKNSGETSANSCRKNEATSTSPSSRRYLWIAPQEPGDVEPAREIGERGARRVIRTSSPLQPASKLGLASSRPGAATSGLDQDLVLGLTLPRSRKPPSRITAIAGSCSASRSQPVLTARALTPSSLAQRSISGTPIRAPKRWKIGRIRPHAMETQQHDQGGHARIGLLRLRL